ncbi:hypothetical protein D3C81_1475670 [compost metagenome]
MIQCEGQIRLTAAKIDDRKRPVLRKMNNDILDHLQEPVNLLKLIIFSCKNLAFLIHNAELYEERNWAPFLKNVLLLPIMGERGAFLGRGFG